jgi:ABC-2 type transport system ATP-binding protein
LSAIVVEALRKSYGSVDAVSDVSFGVEAGEVFALLGPNGAGKTTTVEILEGFRPRDGGRVEVLGLDPGDRHQQRDLRARIGVVLQELAVEPYLTVREVLARNAGFYPAPRPVDDVLRLIGLEDKASDRVKALSGGQQRRLDLGLGIIGNPELIFMDEPTTGFDPSARRGAWEVVHQLTRGGATVVLTTHYMDEAEALANRVAVIAQGRIVAEGTPATIGGRDVGEVTIRFRLPRDVVVSELPVAPTRLTGDEVEIRTTEELTVLHELTGWALQRHVELGGLTVNRLTLEEVYLRLTGQAVEVAA